MTDVSRRDCLGLFVAGGAAALPGLAAAQPFHDAPYPSLDALARAKGMRFGSAIGMGRPGSLNGSFNDPRYRALVLAECSLIVPENELKWYAVHTAPDVYNFAPTDRLLAFATEHGLQMRGHNLLWNRDEFTPEWVKAYDFGSRPASAAEKLLVDHIRTVATRYAGKIHSWDVLNETIDPATGLERQSVFSRHLGPRVIDIAFHTAREYLPDAQLVYNDYMGWEVGDEKHRAGVLRLLHRLKDAGVPVDALGVQSHLATAADNHTAGFGRVEPQAWRRFLDEATGMGYGLLITEFDVNDSQLPADILERDRAVAGLGRDYLDLMFAYPQLKQMLCWGLCDRYSWLQTYWPRRDGLRKRGTPYDDYFRPKLLRKAIADAFAAAPARSLSGGPR